MRRRVESWTIERVHKNRARISFPEYQRHPNLWSDERKRLLIDSILQDIDIPKIYLNETKAREYEVIDGTQRLWSIWEFIDDQLPVDIGGIPTVFSELSAAQRHAVKSYELQVTILEDATEEHLRELFVRLQLGLLLVTGEKLNAAVGEMKDFVFEKATRKKFIAALSINSKRFGKETLAAQIAINSFARAKNGSFARTRYEDLQFFFKEYENPRGQDLRLFEQQTAAILRTLDGLWKAFGDSTKTFTNRSYVLSVYLLFEEVGPTLGTAADERAFVAFVFALWKRLRQEVAAGIDRQNRELYAFETMLSSASGERYQIERRHAKMREYFDHYRKKKVIKGD